MKKLFVFVSLCCQIAIAQSYPHVRGFEAGWVWLDPLPNGESHTLIFRTVSGLVVFDPGVTWSGIYSTDTGTSWMEFEPRDEVGNPLGFMRESIQFVDDTIGFATNDTASSLTNDHIPSRFLRTTDGGLHWSTVASAPNFGSKLLAFHMLTRTFGWYEAQIGSVNTGKYVRSLYLTKDGCRTWTAVRRDSVLLNSIVHLRDEISFADSLHGWFTRPYVDRYGDERGTVLRRTIDGGATWVTLWVDSTFYLGPFTFLDSLRGIAGQNAYLQHTTDGGSTWTPAPIWPYDPGMMDSMLFAERVLRNGVYAILAYPKNLGSTRYGFLLFNSTSDFGATWRCDTFPLTSYVDLGVASIFDDSTAALIGKSFDFSSNHGKTWRIEQGSLPVSSQSGVGDIFFLNHRHGFALMGSGYYESFDGGRHWHTRPDLRTASALHAVFDHRIVWMMAGTAPNEMILRSQDSGRTFENVSTIAFEASDDGLTCIAFADSVNGWVGTWRGMVQHTTDGGHTWKVQRHDAGDVIPGQGIGFVSPRTANDVWMCSGLLFHTTNAGEKWDTVALDYSNISTGQSQLVFISPLRWVLVLPFVSGPLETTDGGSSWHWLGLGQVWPYDCVFFDTLHGFAAGYRTFDGGRTWIPYIDASKSTVIQPGSPLWSFWIDSTEAWMYNYGSSGGLLHYGTFDNDTGQSAVMESGGKQSPESVEIISYPNPFSESTEIVIASSEMRGPRRDLSVGIFDVYGHEVGDISRQLRTTGRATFGARGLPSGVYFCRGWVGTRPVLRTLLVEH